jgi:hypothetical protein
MPDIKRMDHIPPQTPLAANLTNLYRATFAEIDELAVQRHMLSRIELRDIWADSNIQKWVAFEDTSPVGVATITNRLGSWPLISPAYFERHFPEHYRASKIWYIGFVGVKPGHPGVFSDLITSMAPQVRDGDGMAVMDFAHYSVAVRKIDQATDRILKRFDPRASGMEIDAQRFWAWTFPDKVG